MKNSMIKIYSFIVRIEQQFWFCRATAVLLPYCRATAVLLYLDPLSPLERAQNVHMIIS